MRTLPLTSILRNCRAAVLFFFLAVSSLSFGQPVYPIDPVIGPMVRIIGPANHAIFFAPVDIPIFAYVVDPGTTNVEFYAGTNSIGFGMRLGVDPFRPILPNIVLPERPVTLLGSVYCLVWSNAPLGSYALTAVTKGTNSYVTYGGGFGGGYISRTSAPVSISVLPNVTPPGTDVVSIVATDPIAIVGTNSWVWPGLSNATPAWANWPPPAAVPCTNWGPKNALFTVRRFGEETNAIVVTYGIGGTASNGVDYVKLPGSVTLPVGGNYSLIPIIPIDHEPPYIPKTVILTLTTNVSSEYIIGIPPRATAVILHEWLRPLPLLLSDGSFHLNAAGPDGAWFTVMNSPDLLNWTSICTNQAVQGSIDFVDAGAPNIAQLFYQAVPQANAPSQ
jgi:hypothetical protein